MQKKWREERVIDKLLFNTKVFTLSEMIMYQDQDVLNHAFKDECIKLNPKFNVQFSTLTNNTNKTSYNHIDMHFASLNPVIIHYTGVGKPWNERGVYNPLWKRYWHYIKYTPYSFLLESKYKELFAKSLVNLYGAADRTKRHLSYRLGEVLLKTRSLSSAFSLLSRLRKAVKAYKSDKVAYNTMVKIYPDLKLTKLENYSDYQESLKLVNARIANLESNLHIEIDMERVEDRSKALSYIGIEIADALKLIPTPVEDVEKVEEMVRGEQIKQVSQKEQVKHTAQRMAEPAQTIASNTVISDNVMKQKAQVQNVNAVEPQVQNGVLQESVQIQEEKPKKVKSSLWNKIKNSKLVRSIKYALKIKVVLQLPEALPEPESNNK